MLVFNVKGVVTSGVNQYDSMTEFHILHSIVTETQSYLEQINLLATKMKLLHSLATLLLLGLAQAGINKSAHLRLSAVVSGPNGKAAFECWQLENPFIKYPTVGEATDLAKLSNVTYVVLPPGSNEGIHKPPHPM